MKRSEEQKKSDREWTEEYTAPDRGTRQTAQGTGPVSDTDMDIIQKNLEGRLNDPSIEEKDSRPHTAGRRDRKSTRKSSEEEETTISKKRLNNRQEKISRSDIIRPYRIVSYISIALFIGLIGYLIWFQVNESNSLLNNSNNERQVEVEASITRGSILSGDGSTVLAETQTAEDGTETRVYPYGSLFAHTVGYQVYGGSGLEASQNSVLTQSHANILTQVQNDLDEQKKAGDNLVTTLDVNLQQTAANAIGDMKGAAFVMDVDTGDVLADVSSPSFDPNTVETSWDSLTTNEDGVLMNRAMQGLYPPGSTFKMLTSLAYLRQNGSFDGFSYNCTGTFEYAGFTIHCASYEAHGAENFADAFANSCNCAFASMAVNSIDKSRLRQTAESVGFNKDLSLQLPCTASEFTADGNTADQLYMQTAIGQGDTLATPMQICMIADAIANGGTMMEPNFVKSVVSADNQTVSTGKSKAYGEVMTADEASKIRDLMYGVVQRGTASELASLPYQIAGKTGTAEYGDVSEGKAHSWFVGFSNTGNNDIVVCVLIEGGGNGVYPAAPVAGQIFQSWFSE